MPLGFRHLVHPARTSIDEPYSPEKTAILFMATSIVPMQSRNSVEGSEVVTPVAELTLRAN